MKNTALREVLVCHSRLKMCKITGKSLQAFLWVNNQIIETFFLDMSKITNFEVQV